MSMNRVCRKLFKELCRDDRVATVASSSRAWEYLTATNQKFATLWNLADVSSQQSQTTGDTRRTPLLDLLQFPPAQPLESRPQAQTPQPKKPVWESIPTSELPSSYTRLPKLKARRRLFPRVNALPDVQAELRCPSAVQPAQLDDLLMPPPPPKKMPCHYRPVPACIRQLDLSLERLCERSSELSLQTGAGQKRPLCQKKICNLLNTKELCSQPMKRRARLSEPLPKRTVDTRVTDYFVVRRSPFDGKRAKRLP